MVDRPAPNRSLIESNFNSMVFNVYTYEFSISLRQSNLENEHKVCVTKIEKIGLDVYLVIYTKFTEPEK